MAERRVSKFEVEIASTIDKAQVERVIRAVSHDLHHHLVRLDDQVHLRVVKVGHRRVFEDKPQYPTLHPGDPHL